MKTITRNSIILICILAVVIIGTTKFARRHANTTAQPTITPSSAPTDDLLNPTDYNLPPTAKEVRNLRTPSSVTFELSPGKYAAVSFGADTVQASGSPTP